MIDAIAVPLVIFAASFVFVFSMGLQQLNVAGGHAGLAFTTAIVIGVTNLVQFKVLPGPTGVLAVGGFLLGGATGVVSSMRAHPVLLRWLQAWRIRRGKSMSMPQDRADRLAKRLNLALTIAEPAAVSDIERYCPSTVMSGVSWYDTARAGIDHAEIEPENEYEVRAAAIAVEFLDASEMLIHHPNMHALVRFKP